MKRLVTSALIAVLAVVCITGSTHVGSADIPAERTFMFSYSVTVDSIPEGADQVSVWVPLPKSGSHQTVSGLKVRSKHPYAITREDRYGNTMVQLELTHPVPGSVKLAFRAKITRQAYNMLPGNLHDDTDLPQAHDLEPHTLIPIDGVIAELALDVTKDTSTPLEAARAIYNYVTDTVAYDKSGEGWGRRDALYACDARQGNCTDFHSMIIGMARAVDIPARFVVGFPLPEGVPSGRVNGYHCWAEMYIEGIGWLPVDSSEARKHPEKRDAFFGGLDANRVGFTTGRDLELVPAASHPLNFFVYPHIEVDGREHLDVTKRWSFINIEG